jgi:hypothetical protein
VEWPLISAKIKSKSTQDSFKLPTYSRRQRIQGEHLGNFDGT